MTGFQLHMAQWKDCQRCGLCHNRQRVVLARGQLPCDAFFCGEGPGRSEDILGVPMVGPAGKLLDSIIARAVRPGLRWAITNLVACLTVDEDNQKRDPEPEEIAACRPRLEQLLAMARPRLVVAVGKLANDYLQQGFRHSVRLPDRDTPVVQIPHPAHLLRINVAARGLLIQKCIIALRNAVAKHLPQEVANA